MGWKMIFLRIQNGYASDVQAISAPIFNSQI